MPFETDESPALAKKQERQKRIRSVLVDSSIILGAIFTTIGAGMFSVPAGFITFGVLLLSFGIAGARSR